MGALPKGTIVKMETHESFYRRKPSVMRSRFLACSGDKRIWTRRRDPDASQLFIRAYF